MVKSCLKFESTERAPHSPERSCRPKEAAEFLPETSQFCGVFVFAADELQSEKSCGTAILPSETVENSLHATTLTATGRERQVGAQSQSFSGCDPTPESRRRLNDSDQRVAERWRLPSNGQLKQMDVRRLAFGQE